MPPSFKRAVPEPQLAPRDGSADEWMVTLDPYREGSTYREEREARWAQAIKEALWPEYHNLARDKALAYIKQNGLRLKQDLSTLSGIKMVVVRD